MHIMQRCLYGVGYSKHFRKAIALLHRNKERMGLGVNRNEIRTVETRRTAEPRLLELDFVPVRMRAEVVHAQRLSETFVAAVAQLTALTSRIRSLFDSDIANRLRHS